MAFVQDTQNDPNAQQPSTSGAVNQLPQTSGGGGGSGANTSAAGSPQGATHQFRMRQRLLLSKTFRII